ncbi:hypothetical protein [uncultured Sulfitobacter sp.]|uniref:calcium-binding protein n=1 Tax=uncultured Sulfitobacter sp. TaxID=191468 RepID=UPI002635FAC8|nr:hypothetical protein [uncultured Sulfitobacter sp.]
MVDASLGSAGIDVDMDAGDDSVFGGIGDVIIADGAGDDVLSGVYSNDTQIGGAGNDRLSGDGTSIYTAGDGNETTTEFNTINTGALNDGDSTNNDLVDLAGFYNHIVELRADYVNVLDHHAPLLVSQQQGLMIADRRTGED